MNASKPSIVRLLLVLGSFVWAMVNAVEATGSAIILWNRDGYREETFTVDKLYHDYHHRYGLMWGLIGHLPDGDARLYDPRMADGKKLKFSGLRRKYPPGMTIPVMYNPTVTSTLFQRRTLRVIRHTPDLVKSEWGVIKRWALTALLPFLIIYFFAVYSEKKDGMSARTKNIPESGA